MLLFSRGSQDMYQYLMVYFVQRYINPEYMGQDAVFVHLFEKYINTGQADFFTKEYNEYMTKRAYSLMANLIGLPASNLEMVDTLGRPTPLYGVKANLTLVCFWDPTCGHCKETIPRIDSIYKAKWKNLNVAIYAVMTDGGKDNWLKFIHEKDLRGWLHVYQLPSKAKEDSDAQRPSYKQLYDVYQTPTLFLLDKDKKIIAKKLAFEQMDEIITIKSKK
jgi:thiol-disulfide isomerase/thioredoxin